MKGSLMNTHIKIPHHITLKPVYNGMLRSFTKVKNTILLWEHKKKSREDLAVMDEHLLKDLGLTKTEVNKEINKAFWQ